MLTKNNTCIKNGAKILIDTLADLGVDTIFGYPGGIVLDLYNELYNQSDIRHILVRHEQSAVHAAEGYARVMGKCGVVLVTSGPGATNTVSGIVNAYLDGYPLVVLTGQVFNNLLGKNAFQEADICDITKSCTKKVYQIKSADEIQDVLIKAFTLANSGKKGPVVIDMVKDIFKQDALYKNVSVNLPKESLVKAADVQRIYERILSSARPVIVAGGGVVHSKAENELEKFVKVMNIPIVSTMMGLGTFPQNLPNYLGMIGIFGDKAANQLLKESDLIISLGARFNDRITCMFEKSDFDSKFIQIDINEKEISNFVKATDYIVCDIKDFLTKLNEFDCREKIFGNWLGKVQDLRKLNVIRDRKTNLLHSFEVLRKIEEFTKGKSVTFTSEVGQHQLWAVQNISQNKDRRILVSGGSGTMGFGFPAAIGVAVANSENPVVCITGDGSFQMGLHELATCADYHLNIKIMILNNGYLGMVRQLQEKQCHSHYSQTKISNPDFVKLAQSYGLQGIRVSTVDQIDDALSLAFSTNETFVIDFAIEPMEVL
jgi:acetolactate synthase, large subunit, biosynthetic type